MSSTSLRGNIPGENHEGSRSFLHFRKHSKRKIPEALFARPLSSGENEPEPTEQDKKTAEQQRASKADLVHNKRLTLIISLTQTVGFLTPVWAIFGSDHLGLSLTLSLVLGSTGWVTSAIFEVPLGAFSDRYGRKVSFIAGLGLCALGDFSLVVFRNFWLLIAFQVVAGLGFAMRSGSLESLLHDTYEASGETTAYSRLSSTMLFLMNVSRIATIPVGAWIYDLRHTFNDAKNIAPSTPTYPYIASVCALFISLSCATLLIEKRSSQRSINTGGELTEGHLFSRIWQQTSDSWKEMMSNRVVKRVAITLGLYAFIGEGNWALYQSYFREHGMKVGDTWWIYSGLLFFMALGSLYVVNIYKKINVMWAMNAMIAITTIDLAFVHLPIYIAIFAFGVSAFIASMSWYLQDNAIQNRMSGEHKTTALSIASMIYNVGAMVGVFGIGAIADQLGVMDAQWYLVAYGVIVCVGLSIWFRRDGLEVLDEDVNATAHGHGHTGSDSAEEGDDGPETRFDDVPQLKP